jgi:hypothetical protein
MINQSIQPEKDIPITEEAFPSALNLIVFVINFALL